MTTNLADLGFSEKDLADLDSLLAIEEMPEPRKKISKRGAKVVEPQPVERRESPVPVGLVAQVDRVHCKTCEKHSLIFQRVLVKYSYRGGISKKPLGEFTSTDYARLMKEKAGSRETEVKDVEIELCEICSKVVLEMWEADIGIEI
jgi:hypothetical protein